MKNQKMKTVLYWIFTGLLSFELVYGALWDFNILNKGYVYDTLKHLGYPLYLAGILGIAKLIAVVIIISPKSLLPKEWAYTGVVILFAGAVASHIFSGDTAAQYGFAMGFIVITILSYLLRPQTRRLLTT
jgi:DoxX-like family